MFAQLCVEDLALDVKLKDMKYIQSQLRCVLADNNDFCDPFGLKLKRKFFLLISIHKCKSSFLPSFNIAQVNVPLRHLLKCKTSVYVFLGQRFGF